MKRILYFLLCLAFYINLTAGEFFFINDGNQASLENVSNNNIVKVDIVSGKTYSVSTNSYTIYTSTNDTVNVKFSNDMAVKLNENTSFQLNLFDQNILNTNKFPEKLLHNNSQLIASLLQGQIEVINDGNSSTNMIMTKYAIIVPNNGRFIVGADRSKTVIICIDGSIKVIDTLNKKRHQTINKNDVLIVIPPPLVSGKGMDMIKRQNIFTNNKLDETEYKSYDESLSNLYTNHTNIMFISFDGKVYGLKK